MGVTGPILAQTAGRTLMWAEKYLVGITPAMFARKPQGPHAQIDMNHPAWLYGHLALYPEILMRVLGRDPTPVAPPANFKDLFFRGTACQDDPTATVYPAMDAITGAFFKGMRAVTRVVEATDDATFAKPNPDDRLAETFPTVGYAVAFLTSNHVAMHMGQVSAWRRCMGLGPA